MGDRGNIAVIHSWDTPDQVWLYSHWGGGDLPLLLKNGLKRGQPRWDDAQYLTRILFEAMVPKEEHGEQLSYGITTKMHDNEHQVLVVDVPGQIVFIINPKELTKQRQVPGPKEFTPGKAWAFEAYITLARVPKI